MAPLSCDESEDRCDLSRFRQSMSRRLRQNLSDPALRSSVAGDQLLSSPSAGSSHAIVETPATAPTSPREALKRCLAAATRAENTGRLAPPCGSGHTPRRSGEVAGGARGSSAPGSPARLSRCSSSGTIGRGKSCSSGQEHSSQARVRQHSKSNNRPFYMASLNSNPIPLRGRRRGGEAPPEDASVSASVVSHDASSDIRVMTPVAKATKDEKLAMWLRCPDPLLGREPADAAKHSEFTVCSIATPREATAPPSPDSATIASDAFSESCKSSSATAGLAEVQRQLQETRDRLATVEAEQRRLISTSLGALITKAASTRGAPLPIDCSSVKLPSCSTFTCQSPGSDTIELPADTMMVPGVETSPLSRNGRLDFGLDQTSLRYSRLEDENRLLREAIARANQKNSELAARREAAEARSRLLEEENRRAEEALHGGKRNSEIWKCSAGDLTSSQLQSPSASTTPSPTGQRMTLHATVPVAATEVKPVHGDGSAVEAVEAHRNLVDRSHQVDRLLGDLLARRGHLQEKLQPATGLAMSDPVG